MAKPPESRSRTERRGQREDTRERLVREGLGLVLEQGWAATGIDAVLRSVGVPKGSFYHYFSSKDAFGFALLDSYQAFFLKRLERCFGAASDATFAAQLSSFLEESTEGMRRFDWRRGCLIGALGQELGGLHEDFRVRLDASLAAWESILAAALRRARARGEIEPSLDADRLARGFWSTWEGAVLRARLARSPLPLTVAIDDFRHLIHPRGEPHVQGPGAREEP
ncbi:TetR family transcriptional regulator [Cystobacter fuscus]|uniref:TetR family transcriptional regulator n=1 Tax=Cystobacter fuscus TaxID=43 RepID=A0A250J893_9BACT|nr:TetR family transcriptional regulator C-terminal domain-containing protein [Cystobacter fuscus]ATB39813.1 TetR family transcriptional regulator [Cystobacter fuscus]